MDERIEDHVYAVNGLKQAASQNHKRRGDRYALATDRPTYVYIRMPIRKQPTHYAAIQLCISPFTVSHIPDQVFFSNSVKYAYCCAVSETANAVDEVQINVQNVYDAFYNSKIPQLKVAEPRVFNEPRPSFCGTEQKSKLFWPIRKLHIIPGVHCVRVETRICRSHGHRGCHPPQNDAEKQHQTGISGDVR